MARRRGTPGFVHSLCEVAAMLIRYARTALVGLLAAVFFCAGSGPAAAQATLRYKFKEGDKLRYHIDYKFDTHINPVGRDIQNDMQDILDLLWTVNQVDAEGRAKITATIERIQFSMSGQTKTIQYDSRVGKAIDDPTTKQVNPVLKALSGAELTFTLDARGMARDFQAPEAVAKALKSYPGGVGAEMGEYFSVDGLKRLVCGLQPLLPREAAAKDKTWRGAIELHLSPGIMRISNKYTYEGAAKHGDKMLEKISVQPEISTRSNPDRTFVSFTLKNQETSGTAWFDQAAGRVVEVSLSENTEIDTGGGGQTIKRKAKGTIEMKLAGEK
jgi:hypothetical protein